MRNPNIYCVSVLNNRAFEDRNGDPLPDWIDLGELDHLLLLEDGAGHDEFASHKRLVTLSSFDCVFCDSGVPSDALRAYLYEDDRSLVKEFMAGRP